MQAILSLAFVIALGVEMASAGGGSWSYDDHHGVGPTNWKTGFPSCGGSKQSPINIEDRSAELTTFDPFVFTGYDTASSDAYFTVVNNGHTVQLNVPVNLTITISGGGLPDGTYRLAQFHAHWGADNTVGSEHTVDGKFYPVEIHLVHFNTKYQNIGAALDHSDGLAVLGIFAEVGSTANGALQNFIDVFSNVVNAESNTRLKAFPMKGLLPSNTKEFTRYDGSLTTPGCSEVVTWTVFKKPITISQTQLNQFRTLNHNKDGLHFEALVNNYRPVQPVGNRRVKRSFGSSNVGSDAHRQLVAASVLYGLAFSVAIASLWQ